MFRYVPPFLRSEPWAGEGGGRPQRLLLCSLGGRRGSGLRKSRSAAARPRKSSRRTYRIVCLRGSVSTYIQNCLSYVGAPLGPKKWCTCPPAASSLKPRAIFTRLHMVPSVERVLPICSNGFAPLNKMATMPIYGKNILLYSLQDSSSTKFDQIMTVSSPLIFLRQCQICVPMYLYGENVEKSFSQNVLKTWLKLTTYD